MTDKPGKKPERTPQRRLLRAVATAFALLALTATVSLVALYEPNPKAGAPAVLVSVDRSLWNRVGLNRFTYIRHLRRSGLRTIELPFPVTPAVELDDEARALVAAADGLVLTGGGDVAAARYGGDPSVTRGVEPARDRFELGLLAAAEYAGLPVLGLCRGAQLLNVFRGGTLGDFRDDASRYGRHLHVFGRHPVRLVEGSRLGAIYGTNRLDDVTTWHGQHVALPGEGVEIVARSPDGTPEAIEQTGGPDGRFVLGVQWHAEVPPWDRRQARLFDAYADAVRRHASTKHANRAR
jgi:putative glutamine amidotransferase